MLKILTLLFLLIALNSNTTYANDSYKIIVKIDNEIISNHDIKKEKRYLSALNPKILNISEDEINKIAKQSLIREIIKEKEISKFIDIDYQSPNLIRLAEKIYTRLNINSVEEFKLYLKNYDLDLNNVLKKLAIETNWNTLIYERYKDQINIDRDKIKKKLELESSTEKNEKFFLLSEIVFTSKNKIEYDVTYKKILDSIKEKDFSTAATIYSLSETAKYGGEIGWVSKNDISKKIYEQIATLKINEITKPLKIGTGFLLIRVNDIKEEIRKNNLEEQFEDIVTKETNKQLNQHSNIFYKKLENKSFIYEY